MALLKLLRFSKGQGEGETFSKDGLSHAGQFRHGFDTCPRCAGLSVSKIEAACSAFAERRLSSAACSTSYATSNFSIGQVKAMLPSDLSRVERIVSKSQV